LDIVDLPVKSIFTSEVNPRKEFDEDHLAELSESLADDGQWNPIIVRPIGAGYELIAGECRLRAAERLGWKTIRCNVVSADDQDAQVLALKTNMLRRDLNVIEEAEAVADMLDRFDLTQEDVAELLGKKQSWVSRRLSLASRLCHEVKRALKEGKITACHALALVNLTQEEQADMCRRVVVEGLSVRAVQGAVKSMVRPPKDRESPRALGRAEPRTTKGCLRGLVRRIERSLRVPIDVDEYSTRDGLVYIIRVNTNGRTVLRRKDMLETRFDSFDEAQDYAKGKGGYCAGLFTVQGRKCWICYVDPGLEGGQRQVLGLEAY
jgi:ParB family chromosome partitioning protein